MRITIAQMIAAIIFTGLSYASDIKAQSVLDRNLSLSIEETPLHEALIRIGEKANVRFIYSKEFVEANSNVSLNVRDRKLGEILKTLLEPLHISFEAVDELIVLQKSEPTLSFLAGKVAPILQSRKLRQDFTVSGTVRDDETGESLPGVSVTLKGTDTGGATDMDGSYSFFIPASQRNGTLVVSFLGYLTQEVPLNDRRQVDVQLERDVARLDEVVVVGYGTAKKRDLTGAVTRLDAEKFETLPATNLLEHLSGTVPGFNSNQNATASGGGSMEIRGPNSLNANTQPLIVLDGVVYNGNIRDINPNDIESIDFLKDASSAAVFGARSAAGIIIVTTKKGKEGKPTINFSSSVGMSELYRSIKPFGPEGYTEFRKEYYKVFDPTKPAYYFEDPERLPDNIDIETWRNYSNNPNQDNTAEWLNRLNFTNTEIENYFAGRTVDWFKEVTQRGIRQDYDISMSGGTRNVNYYLSAGYTDNNGIVLGDAFRIFRSRLNLEANVTDFLKLGMYNQFSSSDQSSVQANLTQLYRVSPYGSMYEDDGQVRWYPHEYTGGQNPLIDYLNQDKLNRMNSLFSTLFADVTLPMGFSYRISFQNRLAFTKEYNFWPSTTIAGGRNRVNGYGTRQDDNSYEWMIDNIVKWNRDIGKHAFDFTFLFNLEKLQTYSSYQSNENFGPNENLSYNGLQFGSNPFLTNDDTRRTADALMFRLNYTYDARYLLTASWRRDGYSAFGQKNPRAAFPALALAWRLSEEDFFNVSWVDQLKFRASWGLNGNRDIGTYAALAKLASNLYYDGSQVLSGVFSSTLANPNLRWEKTEKINFGLDLSLFSGKLDFTADYYHSLTKDLLMKRNLPTITGYTDITTNLGRLSNRGFEMGVNAIVTRKNNFEWAANLAFSLNRNRIEELWGDVDDEGNEVPDYTNKWFPGESIDRIWDYNVSGIWQLSEIETANGYGLTAGDLKAVDVNQDGTYRELDDKIFLGWSTPRYRLGLGNTFKVLKNIEAYIFLRADLGHKSNLAYFLHGSSNTYDRNNTFEFSYWTAEHPSDKYPRLNVNNAPYEGGIQVYSPRSFVRVQDVSVAYQFPGNIVQRLRLSSLKLFISARNLYTFTEWEGWDPESGNTPMPRRYSLGINLFL